MFNATTQGTYQQCITKRPKKKTIFAILSHHGSKAYLGFICEEKSKILIHMYNLYFVSQIFLINAITLF